MLKLTLVQGDDLCIGDNIKVRLAPDGAYRTSLLVEAPDGVDVKRMKSVVSDEPIRELKTDKRKISIVDNRRL